jgi:hypothetical protein
MNRQRQPVSIQEPGSCFRARMAKSADAADLKSAGRKAVGVQVPLRAPSRSTFELKLCSVMEAWLSLARSSSGALLLDCRFNPDVYAQQELGTIGVLPRGRVAGNHRSVRVAQKSTLRASLPLPGFLDLQELGNRKIHSQFRAETFNLTNTPRYAQPANTIASWNPGPYAGQIKGM